MWPLTLLPKFDIIQAKCTYGFTHTPPISMNQNIALTTVVSSAFITNPKYKSNQMILQLNAPVLINSKITDTVVSSVQESETSSGFINGKYDVPLRNALHEIGHIQGPTPIQFDNIFPTASSLTQLYNTDPKPWTCTFIGFVIDSDKTISCSLETRKTQSFRLSINTSFHRTSNSSSTYLCTQYHPRTNKKSV